MIQRLLKKNVSMRNAIVLQQQIVSSKQQLLCYATVVRNTYEYIDLDFSSVFVLLYFE